jgi:probable addiction module antidote protein
MIDVKFQRYDVVNYLKTEDDISAYLDAVMEEGDPELIAAALGDVARSANSGCSMLAASSLSEASRMSATKKSP